MLQLFSRVLPVAFAALAILPATVLAEQTDAPPSSELTDIPRPSAVDPAALPSPLETIEVEAVERGQKGYGLSVFSGQEPERFDVEVIGVWRNSSPKLSYLLARLSGKDLERSGVLQGMSGSPVFIDDKLVGAVAFSFPFGLDPIAGITPIASMRSLTEAGGGLVPRSGLESAGAEPVSTAGGPRRTLAEPSLVPTYEQMVSRSFDAELLEGHLRLLAPQRSQSTGHSALMWTAAGFGEQARGLLAGHLGELAPAAGLPMSGLATGGPTGTDGVVADPQLRPGDAVALTLVRGDLSLAAHGTVTDRLGESIVAFGHPIYGLGPVRLPMAESEVITTIPSVNSSFKLSNAGRLLGVFDQDREPGAHGVLGAEPSLVPMDVKLRGLERRDYSMQLADTAMFKPTLIAVSAFGALNSGSFSSGFQGLDLEATLSLDGHEDLHLRQSFDGNQAASNAIVYLLTFAAFLELNELQPTSVSGIDLTMHQFAQPRLETLTAVRADRSRVRPGDTVRLWLDVQPYRGEKERRTFEVELPDDLEAGPYYLMVGDGSSMDAARVAVEKRQPQTFEQQLASFRTFHSRKELHVLGLAPSRGRSLGGGVLPDLPPSMRAVYGGAAAPLHLRIVQEVIEEAAQPLEGIHRVDLVVERPRGL